MKVGEKKKIKREKILALDEKYLKSLSDKGELGETRIVWKDYYILIKCQRIKRIE